MIVALTTAAAIQTMFRSLLLVHQRALSGHLLPNAALTIVKLTRENIRSSR